MLIGQMAELTRPDLSREIDENRNTGRAARLKRAILHARLERARTRGDIEAIENNLTAFWKGDGGDKFHDVYAAERFGLFRKQHSVAIDTLARMIEDSGLRLTRLVEIGCGDGSVLAESASRLPTVTEAIGIDINAAVVARNSAERPPGGKFLFVNADARKWLMTHPKQGTVVLSNGGVLEYFSQENFDRLLQTLALSRPAAIIMIEPVAPDHDLGLQLDSYAYGHENSFSHNHRERLTRAGFRVAWAEEMHMPNVRWMLMIGIVD
jgi:SAM-dependent methyltransferase